MELPTVDPMADDYLEQLFAWGDAFRELYGLTERTRPASPGIHSGVRAGSDQTPSASAPFRYSLRHASSKLISSPDCLAIS